MLHVDLDNIITHDELAGRAEEVLKKADEQQQIVVVTRNGRPAVAVIKIEMLEELSGRTVAPAMPATVVDAPPAMVHSATAPIASSTPVTPPAPVETPAPLPDMPAVAPASPVAPNPAVAPTPTPSPAPAMPATVVDAPPAPTGPMATIETPALDPIPNSSPLSEDLPDMP